MKWTNAKVMRLSKQEIIKLIEEATNTRIAYTGASLQELRNELGRMINQGLI